MLTFCFRNSLRMLPVLIRWFKASFRDMCYGRFTGSVTHTYDIHLCVNTQAHKRRICVQLEQKATMDL